MKNTTRRKIVEDLGLILAETPFNSPLDSYGTATHRDLRSAAVSIITDLNRTQSFIHESASDIGTSIEVKESYPPEAILLEIILKGGVVERSADHISIFYLGVEITCKGDPEEALFKWCNASRKKALKQYKSLWFSSEVI